jgi:outer membrane protein assembly factor BamB
MLHALNPQTGEDVTPPAKFVGAGANLTGAILIEDSLYAAATGACGPTANGVYAIELGKNNTIRSWDAGGASLAGSAGPAFSATGTVFVATGGGQSPAANSIVALEPATLAQKDAFTAPAPFTSSPIVLTLKGRELVAAANQDGRLYVLDATALGGADRKTPLAVSAPFTGSTGVTPGALATWEEANGTRWILVPVAGPVARAASFPATNGNATAGSIVAFRLVDENGALSLQPGWVSRELASPVPPAIVNGIVFAVSGGDSRTGSAASRAGNSTLYALDAATGQELWNSGSTIASFARVGPSAGDSQVYVVTQDGTVYAFGIPLEH